MSIYVKLRFEFESSNFVAFEMLVQREWTFVEQDFLFLFHKHIKYLHRSSIIVILCVKPSNWDLLIFDQFSPSNSIIAFPNISSRFLWCYELSWGSSVPSSSFSNENFNKNRPRYNVVWYNGALVCLTVQMCVYAQVQICFGAYMIVDKIETSTFRMEYSIFIFIECYGLTSCLYALDHYLNQYWLLLCKFLQYFLKNVPYIYHDVQLNNH